MKVLTFARDEGDLTDNSRTPTGTKRDFRSPSPSQNSLVLKFPNGGDGDGWIMKEKGKNKIKDPTPNNQTL